MSNRSHSTPAPLVEDLRSGGQGSGRRVLVVAPQPFYTDRGTPIATRYLIEALVELGYEVDVLTYPFGRALSITGVSVTRIPNPLGLRGVPVGFSWRKFFLDLFLFPALTRRLGSTKYACVSAVEESAFVAALVAPRLGVPVLYDMQSSLAEQLGHIAPFRSAFARRLLEACERWLLSNVDVTMTSAGLFERVRTASPGAAVHEWRYPALMEPAPPAAVDRLRAELGLTSDARVVLYAGNFAEYQGLQELVDAMPAVLERVPEAVLVLVGAERADAIELADRLPAGSAHVLARQPQRSIPPYLGLAHVLVSPRQFGDNLPLKVLDYMAAGRAIVATDIPAHRTVLQGDRALLVDPDPASLAEGIATLLEDPERRKGLGLCARQFAEEKFGWLRYVHSVGEAYAQVCGDDRKP